MRNFFFIAYLLSSFGALLGVLFDLKMIEVVCKPIIVPVIFVYYLYQSDFKIRGTFTSILILSFASDMTSIFEIEKGQLFVIILNLAINLLFLKSFLKDYFKLNSVNFRQIINGSSILLSLLVIVVICLTLIPNLSLGKMIYYLFYGFILALMSTIAIYNSILNNNLKIFYAVVVSITFIITDVFYVLYNFYLPMKIFLLVNLGIQFTSYFFTVNYFTTNLRNNE
jgi:hypothetical protein